MMMPFMKSENSVDKSNILLFLYIRGNTVIQPLAVLLKRDIYIIAMQEILDKKLEGAKLSDKEIFIKIWTSPRQVFKFINDNGYDKYVIYLLVLSGISGAFYRAIEKNMGDNRSLWTIVGTCLIVGGLLGWMPYYFYAALVNWIGKWLKAEGNTNSILMMLSYALIPQVVALILLIPQIAIYGNDIFKSDENISDGGLISNFIYYTAIILEFILVIWTIFLCVIGTSEVQKLSIGKAILNLLLPLIVIFVIIVIIVLLLRSFQ